MDLFVLQLKGYGLVLDYEWLAVSAWALIIVECTLGVGLILFYRPKLTLTLTGILFLCFQGVTSWAWLTNATKECGCFGVWLQRSPGEAAVESLLMFAATVVSLIMSRFYQARQNRIKALAVICASIGGFILPFVFGFSLSQTEQSSWEKIEDEIARLEVLGLDDIDFSQGEYLIVLMATDCDHCQDVVPELNSLSQGPNPPSVVGLCANYEEQVSMFLEEFQPTFRIGRIKENAFWHLLREGEMPRIILVRDKKVQQVWDHTIPTRQMIDEIDNVV